MNENAFQNEYDNYVKNFTEKQKDPLWQQNQL